MLVGMPPGHLGQIEGHRCRVGVRQDQADEFPVLRADAAEDVGVLADPVGGDFGAAAQRRPAARWIAHPSEAGFIFKEQAQRLVRVPSRHRVHLGLKFF